MGGATRGGRGQGRGGGVRSELESTTPGCRAADIADGNVSARTGMHAGRLTLHAACQISSLVRGTMLDINRLIATLPARRMSSRAAGRAGQEAGGGECWCRQDVGLPGGCAAIKCNQQCTLCSLMPASSRRLT